MATYGELQTEVGEIIIDLPSTVTARVPFYVKRAVRRLQQLHNFEIMKTETATLTTTYQSHVLAAVPSNFKEYRRKPYLIGAQGGVSPLEIANDRADVAQLFGDDAGGEADLDILMGPPRVIVRTDSSSETTDTANWEVWPLPDATSLYANGQYRIRIPYWKFLPDLSNSSDQNWFTNNCDEWIAYQAAAMGFFSNQDPDNGTQWQQLAGTKWQDVMSADKRYKASTTDTLVPQPRAYGPVIGLRNRFPLR